MHVFYKHNFKSLIDFNCSSKCNKFKYLYLAMKML